LCVMLWDMLRFENYDESSPYNREAAAWAKSQTFFRLPIDDRPLRDKLASRTHEDLLPRLELCESPDASPFRRPLPRAAALQHAAPDVLFLGDVVEAEVVASRGGASGEILFIE
jgi:hypothetical protein